MFAVTNRKANLEMLKAFYRANAAPSLHYRDEVASERAEWLTDQENRAGGQAPVTERFEAVHPGGPVAVRDVHAPVPEHCHVRDLVEGLARIPNG